MGGVLPAYIHVNTGVVDARHLIVKAFLRTDQDICVMCDDDTIPPIEWPGIVEHVAEGRADICAAVVPIAVEGTTFLPNVFRRDDTMSKGYALDNAFIKEKGLQEVDAVGTGLIAIHRRVFEDKRLVAPFKASFGDGPGEDVSFCRRAKEAGFLLTVDFDIWCDHYVEVHANGLANAYMSIIHRGLGGDE